MHNPSIDDYKPPILLRNGMIATIFPFYKRAKLDYPHKKRERFQTFDNDFIDIDIYNNDNSRVALLLHGLEGSSQSQYIKAISNRLSKLSWDIYAINHRSCSGEMNKNACMYHSGFTDDIHMAMQHLCKNYDEISIIGYSMGGNMALKYAGDGRYEMDLKLKKIIAISVPIDLASSSIELASWRCKPFSKIFLATLKTKMHSKALQHPKIIKKDDIYGLKNLIDFDNKFTAPLHGFTDAADYYAKSSSKQFIKNIRVQSVLINALDDPFLSKECMPYEEALENQYFNFIPVNHGGHVGFGNLKSNDFWIEDKIINLLDQ